MAFFRSVITVAGILALFALSFYSLDAAQYDVAPHMWLILLTGFSAGFLLIAYGFEGFKKNIVLSLLMFAWCTLVWVSYFYSEANSIGVSEAVILTFAAAFSLCISTLDEKIKRKLPLLVLGVAVASSLYGLIYFPTHGEARMAGLFFDAVDPRHFFPNTFATFLLMTWPLIFLIEKKWLRVLCGSMLATSLLLTFSRGAWLIAILQGVALIGCWLIEKNRTKNYKKIAELAAIGLIAVLAAYGLTQLRAQNFSTINVADKITFNNSEKLTSFNERGEFWQGSLQLIKKNPIIGTGPTTFRYIYPPVQKTFLAISDHPHNWILKTAVESGVFAAIALVMVLAVILYNAFLPTVKNRQLTFSFFIGLGLSGTLLHNLLDFNLNFIPTIITFFILAGTVLNSTKSKKKHHTICSCRAMEHFACTNDGNFCKRDISPDATYICAAG